MTRVTSVELLERLGQVIEDARQGPVTVTKHDRDHVVILSAEEYVRLTRLDREVYGAGSLPDDWLAAVEQSRMDPRHDHLNDLLEQKT